MRLSLLLFFFRFCLYDFSSRTFRIIFVEIVLKVYVGLKPEIFNWKNMKIVFLFFFLLTTLEKRKNIKTIIKFVHSNRQQLGSDGFLFVVNRFRLASSFSFSFLLLIRLSLFLPPSLSLSFLQ